MLAAISRSRLVVGRSFGFSALLTDEQKHLKDAVTKFATQQIEPIAAQIDKSDSYDIRHVFKSMGELGLLGMTCPHDYGGTGLGYFEHALCMEEISRASGSVGLSYLAHSNLCINQIVLNASESLKKKYLPRLCSGEHVGALAISEHGAGSDAVGMAMKAERTEGGYVLNGTKMWITNGPDADVIVVYARTTPGTSSKGLTTFLVEKTFKGFKPSPKLDKLGMRGSPTCELVFDNVFVPEENIIGQLDKGVYVLMKGLGFERLLLSAGPVGLMQKAIDLVVPYVKERKQFGKPIGTFQLVQAKLADMYTSLESTRAYVYATAKLADMGKATNRETASVFLYAGEQGTKVALDAIQCLGGNGYINDYAAGRLLRDAKLYEIGGGTSEIRRVLIGKDLVKG